MNGFILGKWVQSRERNRVKSCSHAEISLQFASMSPECHLLKKAQNVIICNTNQMRKSSDVNFPKNEKWTMYIQKFIWNIQKCGKFFIFVCFRIHPPEFFKEKYGVDQCCFSDEVAKIVKSMNPSLLLTLVSACTIHFYRIYEYMTAGLPIYAHPLGLN